VSGASARREPSPFCASLVFCAFALLICSAMRFRLEGSWFLDEDESMMALTMWKDVYSLVGVGALG
jgi:hypothetical protein